jgi:hypothetical protein
MGESPTKCGQRGHRRIVPDRLSRSFVASVCAWALVAGPIASCAEAEDSKDTPAPALTSGRGGGEDNGGEGGASGATTVATGKGGGSGGTQNPAGGGEGGESPQPGMAGSGDGGAGGTGPECVGPDDCNDDNVCTIDSCNVNRCFHIGTQSACDDDLDPCTVDVCLGTLCTHPSNGSCACSGAGDCDDSNPCTDEDCVDNDCVYMNNALDCADDNDNCTDDVCSGGFCTHPPSGTCECEINVDCNDFNACTDDTCNVDHVCENVPNAATTCLGDVSPCTSDACDQGQCAHADKGTCSGSQLIVIRANKNNRYVRLDADFLEHNAEVPGDAEVFEKVEEANYKFKLRALSNGNYVTLGAGDHLAATAAQGAASIFSAPPCGDPDRGLRVGNDNDVDAWVQADSQDDRMIANRAACDPANDGSWEKFELIPVGAPCLDTPDCDDGNDCTTETCTGGFCVYTELSTACTDDLDACTDDFCDRGACTHKQNGSCAGTTIKISANIPAPNYVVLNGVFLEHNGADFAAGAEFEQVFTTAGEFKLRAGTGMFVKLDGGDNLTADADFATAVIFSSPVCNAHSALVAETDNDTNNYLRTDPDGQPTTNRVLAIGAWCDPGNANSAMKWTIEPSP